MKSMSEITIPEATITDEQYAHNARQLVMTIILQSVKAYCAINSEYERKTILSNLRSSRMNLMSDGMSVIVAEQLELHPEKIAERLRQDGRINIVEEL